MSCTAAALSERLERRDEPSARASDRDFRAAHEGGGRILRRGFSAGIDEEAKKVARQGYAGLLWSKQFYNYVIRDWLAGDPAQPPPPPERKFGRNREWTASFQPRHHLDAG